MGIRNIVWTADRVKCLAVVGMVVMAAACSKSSGTTTLAPSDPFVQPTSYSLSGWVHTTSDGAGRYLPLLRKDHEDPVELPSLMPVEGARVTISRGEDTFEAITDANGYYQFDGLALGTWNIVVEKDGFAPAQTEVDLSDSASVDFMLEPMGQ